MMFELEVTETAHNDITRSGENLVGLGNQRGYRALFTIRAQAVYELVEPMGGRG